MAPAPRGHNAPTQSKKKVKRKEHKEHKEENREEAERKQREAKGETKRKGTGNKRKERRIEIKRR